MRVQSKSNNNYWKKLVAVLSLGWVAIWIYRTVLTPIYPEVKSSLGNISDTQIGLIASFYFFAYCLFQLPAAYIVEKFGQRITLACGFILFTVGALVVANSTVINGIYIGSLIAGAGCASFFSSTYSLVRIHTPAKYKVISTAIVNSGTAIGFFIGVSASSFLVKEMNMHWSSVVIINAIIIAIVGLIIFFTVKPSKTATVPTSKDENLRVTVQENENQSILSFRLISVYFLYFCTCYGYYTIVAWLPSYLQAERGFEGSAIGVASAIVGIVAIPGALFFSSLADKFNSKTVKIIIFLELTGALMLAFTVISYNTTLLMISLITYGFIGKVTLDPILISFTSEHAPKAKMAKALAAFNLSGMMSSIIAPPLTGFISDIMHSKEIAFYLSAGLLVAGTVIFLIINLRSNESAYKMETRSQQ